MNARVEDAELVADATKIHVIRDPRDMVVSAYFSHRDSHPLFEGLAEERNKLKEAELVEGMSVIMNGIMKKTFNEKVQWHSSPITNCLEVKMESFRENEDMVSVFMQEQGLMIEGNTILHYPAALYRQVLSRLCRGVEIPFKGEVLHSQSFEYHLSRLKKNRQQQKSRGQQKQVNVHHRSGKSGQWDELLSIENKQEFKVLFPGLVTNLGCSDSKNW
jgi:hypothetical protein